MTTDAADADLILRTYAELGGDDVSDVELVSRIADRVQIPRLGPADSFVLHAPLELLARAALLPWVGPAARHIARLRVVAIATEFEAEPAIEPSPSTATSMDPVVAGDELAAALASGDLETVDRTAATLATSATPSEFTGLVGDALLPSLAAAGHAPIFLYQYPRVSPRGEATSALLRPLAREIGRYPELQLEWVRDRPTAGGSAAALADALASVPQLGLPGSNFIFPVMHQVDQQVAPELLGTGLAGVGVAAARPVILRAAARTMVLGPVEHAPYGWSHCLTMSQAALEIAPHLRDPSLGVAVAATHVVGFLAALASEPIPASVQLEHPGGTFTDAIAGGMTTAAARALHATSAELGPIRTEIVTRVSARRDAHLTKYTLACLDAMTADPQAARLYLAAAAALLAFWTPIAESDDPLFDVAVGSSV